MLSAYGEQVNQDTIIYIDALNESYHKRIWQTGLSSIIYEARHNTHIKLLFSFRNGYENAILSDEIKNNIKNKQILRIMHYGFHDRTIEAVKLFMDHYGIPFSPSEALELENANPLYLKLFCETFNGEHPTISGMLDRIINEVDDEIKHSYEIDLSANLTKGLIRQFTEKLINESVEYSIPLSDFFSLPFWDTNGLNDKKTGIYQLLKSTGIVMDIPRDDEEYVCFGYDRFRDIAFAKTIVASHKNKKELRRWIKERILGIEKGKIEPRHCDIELFVSICAAYAQTYHEECIDIIDTISDEEGNEHYEGIKDEILSRYYYSFMWRDARYFCKDDFFKIVKKYGATIDDIWPLLIRHAIESKHPLNAECLHTILVGMPIAKRDSKWTTYINGFTSDDRIFQIIDYLERGETLTFHSNAEQKLLLKLFSWFLTSSNRRLRDKTSKAMVEILKADFIDCRYLLEEFQHCNDPYVLQRLYGVIYGACIKRTIDNPEEYRLLVKCVYKEVFDNSEVYPDILLRDYARLIIELWMYEHPEEQNEITFSNIEPPYTSTPLPQVEKIMEVNYDDEPGFYQIQNSLTPDVRGLGVGMYGDFGRYIFEAHIRDFVGIDISNCYYYAISYIKNTLGYEESYLGFYDSHLHQPYDRKDNIKIERIGKKYEWIAFFNILARLSDNYLVKDDFNKEVPFEGPWNPFVRDFDPTLNIYFLSAKNDPIFCKPEFQPDFLNDDNPNLDILKNWTVNMSECIQDHRKSLRISDTAGNKWILLQQHTDYENQIYKNKNKTGYEAGGQRIWTMSHAYVIPKKKLKIYQEKFGNENFFGLWFDNIVEEYELYNMEPIWSKGYTNIIPKQWYKIDDDSYFENQRTTGEEIGEKSPLSFEYMWESGYDGSINETVNIAMPSALLIKDLSLKQHDINGHFYSSDGCLVAFDASLSGRADGLVIREDYLQEFLVKNDYTLIWSCLAAKLFKTSNRRLEYAQSEWSGLYYYQDGDIDGSMHCSEVYV